MNDPLVEEQWVDLDLAIIGMAGRFPGARDYNEFWENLRNGRESIARFSQEELLAEGFSRPAIENASFVPARAVVDQADMFDATFFGFSPREAEVLDPQQRLFLECAWHALEDAGYAPNQYEGPIGVFAGLALNTYLLQNLHPNRDRISSMDEFQIMMLNDKDTLPTRVAYKLNLRGPAVNVQTSCSTGLVAVHLASNSLLNFECDMALAGAVAIKFPQVSGYQFNPDGILSPDGHCRAFDERAAGTVGGAGGGVLVLKRLVDARADGDIIRAVVRGSAINNDGSRKVSYTAPSIVGQSEVIAAAHARARVSADSIGYIEAHGTATPIGDPIEIAALSSAFRATTDRKQFCAIGSVKSNIGHLDTAAGVAGLIKTTLALEENEIPPSLHFKRANPKLTLEESPFFVSDKLQPWPSSSGPRRAGVSSFGVGGTNAHVVLEEAPAPPSSQPSLRKAQIITWSANSGSSLHTVSENLRAHFQKDISENEFADIAFTLHQGRVALPYRRALICHSARDLQSLDFDGPSVLSSNRPVEGSRPIVFLFPGQGSQRPGMAHALYAAEPTFRDVVDRGAEILQPELRLDLRELLLASPEAHGAAALLKETSITQSAVFLYECALASLWAEWGIRPDALMGHSIGQYAAVYQAGVLSFEDALMVVAKRGELIGSLPGGAMTAMSCAAEQVRELLPQQVVLAAVNAPRQCVASGPLEAVIVLERLLDDRRIQHTRLQTSHAFHSTMMDQAVEPFRKLMAGVVLNEPKIAVMSDITGGWLKPDEATNPEYWARHLVAPVKFAEGLASISRSHEGAIWLEIGPRETLTSLARQQLTSEREVFVATRTGPGVEEHDATFESLARVWVEGGSVDWKGFHRHENRRRVRLPVYPFERQRYFVDSIATNNNSFIGKEPIEDWFYAPSWKHKAPVRGEEISLRGALVFADETRIGSAVVETLAGRGTRAFIVRRGTSFSRRGDEFTVADDPVSYSQLLADLAADKVEIDSLVYCWSLDVRELTLEANVFAAAQRIALFPFVWLLQALDRGGWTNQFRFLVVTQGACFVSGTETLAPELAPLLALMKVIPQEYANIQCALVDIESNSPPEMVRDLLLKQLTQKSFDTVSAFRGGFNWVISYERITLPRSDSKAGRVDGGTYLVLGGLGRVGLELAAALAHGDRVNLVLADLQSEETPPAVNVLSKLRSRGVQVVVRQIDIADAEALRALVESVRMEFGRLDGVVHAAGCPEQLTSLSEITAEEFELHFAAKVYGTLALERALADQKVDFVILISSLASILGGLGTGAYAASNAFLDQFAQSRRHSSQNWMSVNVETWDLNDSLQQLSKIDGVSLSRSLLAMSREETGEVLERILSGATDLAQLVVSSGDLNARLSKWVNFEVAPKPPPVPSVHKRPQLSTAYMAPSTELEQGIARTWRDLFGIENIGIRDSFFELGGDSLMAAQLVARIRGELHVDLPLRRLFEKPTIEAVCEAIEAEQKQTANEAEIEKLLTEIEGLSSRDFPNEVA